MTVDVFAVRIIYLTPDGVEVQEIVAVTDEYDIHKMVNHIKAGLPNVDLLSRVATKENKGETLYTFLEGEILEVSAVVIPTEVSDGDCECKGCSECKGQCH